MTLVFQYTSPRYTYYIMHTECKLATCDATSHLAIPGTDFFSDDCFIHHFLPHSHCRLPSELLQLASYVGCRLFLYLSYFHNMMLLQMYDSEQLYIKGYKLENKKIR